MPLSDATLELLAANDDDAFNRWDAAQQLASRVLLGLVAKWQQAAPNTDARSKLTVPSACFLHLLLPTPLTSYTSYFLPLTAIESYLARCRARSSAPSSYFLLPTFLHL